MALYKSSQSSIGKKAVMAISGLLLLGFVIGHLLGNLLIFMGPDALNAYGKKILSLGPGLWVLRIGLLSILLAHIWTAIKITLENKAARPIDYQKKATIETTYAARTMVLSGVITLAFIIYHLMHFTFKVTHPEISNLHDAGGSHDIYSMVVLSFQQPLISAVYIISMALLCMHLSHGISSMFQSLGFNNEARMPVVKFISRATAILIFIGYSSIPVCALTGCLQATGGGA